MTHSRTSVYSHSIIHPIYTCTCYMFTCTCAFSHILSSVVFHGQGRRDCVLRRPRKVSQSSGLTVFRSLKSSVTDGRSGLAVACSCCCLAAFCSTTTYCCCLLRSFSWLKKSSIFMPGGTASGLNETRLASEIPLLVGIQDANQRHLGEIQSLAEQVDSYQDIAVTGA